MLGSNKGTFICTYWEDSTGERGVCVCDGKWEVNCEWDL